MTKTLFHFFVITIPPREWFHCVKNAASYFVRMTKNIYLDWFWYKLKLWSIQFNIGFMNMKVWKYKFTFINSTEIIHFRVLGRTFFTDLFDNLFPILLFFWSWTCYHVFISFCSHKVICLLFRKELITSKLSIDILELPIKGKIQAYIPFVYVLCAYCHYTMGWMTFWGRINIFVLLLQVP